MPATEINARTRRCPVCGDGVLRQRLISEVFEYGDNGDSVVVRTQDVPIEDCPSCGESFSGPEAARIRHEAIGRALGLLTPREIQSIRERLGRSPEEYARLLGVGVDRLCHWEEGSAWQDLTADRLMRLLSWEPGNATYLESSFDGSSEKPEQPGSERKPVEKESVGRVRGRRDDESIGLPVAPRRLRLASESPKAQEGET